MDSWKFTLPESPELRATYFSNLFLFWLFPFVRKGANQDLHLQDIYNVLPEDTSARLRVNIERKWNNIVEKAKLQGKQPKFWKVICQLLFPKYFLVGLGYAFCELFFKIAQSILLRNLIQSINPENKEDHTFLRKYQYLLAGLLIAVLFSHAILNQKVLKIIIHLGMKLRVATSSLIYLKILRVCASEVNQQASVGHICNLLSTDVGRLDQNLHYLHYIYIGPLQLALTSYLLWKELGIACFVGVIFILLFIPLQFILGHIFMRFRTLISSCADKRSGYLSEIIKGIRLIKLYVWEGPFSAVMKELRQLEIKYIRKSLYLKGTSLSFKTISNKLIPFSVLIVYVVMGNTLTADKAFFTVTLLHSLLHTVTNRVPTAVSDLGDLLASMKRIEIFLLSKETCTINEDNNCHANISEPEITMKQFSASRVSNDTHILRNVCINLTGNKLVMVVGPVGSGKSSLLNAILSELSPGDKSSELYVKGKLSYCSQEAWIFSGTLRENILLGLPMDETRYKQVLSLCCLKTDLNQFSDGDMTLLGERGVTLSGGQKARINLARTIYRNADIYLLDDPLSAVDTNVSRCIFYNCIKGHLKEKLRILVTHQMQYLAMADYIILLHEDGTIQAQGTYNQLEKLGLDRNHRFDETSIPNPSQRRQSSITELESNSNSKHFNYLEKDGSEERKSVGSVDLGTYARYMMAGGSKLSILFIAVVAIIAQVLFNLTDYWLSQWTKGVKLPTGNEQSNDTFYAYIYSGIIGMFVVATLLKSLLFFRYCMQISINLHDGMFQSLARASIQFFDENPSGRIMNRFTKDLNHIDENLPVTFYESVNMLLGLLGMLVINAFANYYSLVPSGILLLCLWKLRKFYLGSARDLKRLEALAKSPMFTHVISTLQGLTTIRASNAEEYLLTQFERIQDRHTSVFYMNIITNLWFTTWLKLICVAYMTAVTLGLLTFTSYGQGGIVGMVISTILNVAGGLQVGISQSAETENYMTCVERIFEYSNLNPEAASECEHDKALTNWPSEGRLEFQNLTLCYPNDKSTTKVLDNVSFTIEPNEKIGIVGRTGAGKSSMLTALFRLVEPFSGSILIDNQSIEKVGLSLLRSRISKIPQEPVLFTGTLRYNLDPFSQFKDHQLWKSLKDVGLDASLQNLEFLVTNAGFNLSVGERQLICLARAILRHDKILVVDEATANVDPCTERLVQNLIRTKFSNCTVFIIAHRLETVMDCDKILVLDAGKVLEFDTPTNLMSNDKSAFYAMLNGEAYH